MTLTLTLIIYFIFLFLEYFFPRKKKNFWKKRIILDIAFTIFNSYLFWTIEWNFHEIIEEYFCITSFLHPVSIDNINIIYQVFILFFLFDFIRWWTHRGLHYFSWGWKMHKTHHSITDLHFLKVFYYNPLENFVYIITTLPILLFVHFSWQVFAILGIIDAIIGLLNHSNISLRIPDIFAKIINTPQVHIWHHDETDLKEKKYKYGKNFGINLSLWDWIFGTLYISNNNPEKIGNPQDRTDIEKIFYK